MVRDELSLIIAVFVPKFVCMAMGVTGTLSGEVGFETDDDDRCDEHDGARERFVCENRGRKTRIGKRCESGWQEMAEACCENDTSSGELEVAEDGLASLVVREGSFREERECTACDVSAIQLT